MNFKRQHFSEISSTNDYAKQVLENEPLVAISADNQTLGRGRNGKTWLGDYGSNVYLSIAINHKFIPEFDIISNYQALAALAVKQAIVNLAKKDIFRIKYPNDIYAFDGESFKKIAGILCEHTFTGNRCTSSIIGIGVNVNQKEFDASLGGNATSLSLLNFNFSVDEIIESILKQFMIFMGRDEENLFHFWKNEMNIVNKSISVVGEEGVFYIRQVLDDGRLKAVKSGENKEIIIDNGDSIRYDLK